MKKDIDFYKGYTIKQDVKKGYFFLYLKHLRLCKSMDVNKLYDLVDKGYERAKEKARKIGNWHSLLDLAEYDAEIKMEISKNEENNKLD